MNAKPVSVADDILGYTLIERIGAGGFGEVWAATAPGGLKKAVKLVYGFHDEKRAQAELKSLDRIKEVRHPFLLSLERIEVYNGQLVVVTELADKSVADLFDEYAAKGEPGIPREELIQYMREAGDALDYLSETHQLQHLDIKPENLLLVSGHVKVADFGLVKDLKHDASQSLMSGMTPAYAAPELFDGQPGSKSDQYSLAILYQEMLTSVRPFPGNTPAQLAAQHMHGKPNLRTLPPSDQPVIARALAKDPSVRYPSCREMAEDLGNKKRARKKAVRRITTARDEARTDVGMGGSPDMTAVLTSSDMPFQAVELKTLEPPKVDAENAEFQPTLILTVGKTANRVARKVKHLLVTQNGTMHEIPSTRIIAFDTDRNDISRLCMTGGKSAFASEEAMELPLCKPEAYRDKAKIHLNWLSRRWIYNVPRSLQTEGLRPLGRLAFADHFEKIVRGIQDAILQITQEENLAKSAETLGMNPGAKQPNVLIISSINGGTGSGMTLDLAYTVKLLLAENGFATNCVKGILLHSTDQRTSDPGLAAANAVAFLTELRHYTENGYPGDDSIGIPEFEDEPPMDHVYFQDFGSDLKDTAFTERIESLAEYIHLNSTSKCHVFFDKCREIEDQIDHFAFRTFGLSFSRPGSQSDSSYMVIRQLLKRWSDGDPNVQHETMDFVKQLLTTKQINFESVTQRIMVACNKVVEEKGYQRTQQFARELLLKNGPDRIDQLQDYFDAIFGCPPNRKDSSHVDPETCVYLDQWVNRQAQGEGDFLSNSILAMLNFDQLDLSLPSSAVTESRRQLEELVFETERELNNCEEELGNLSQSLYEMTSIPIEDVEIQGLFEETLSNYCNCRYRDLIFRYSKEFYRVMMKCMGSVEEIIKRTKHQLAIVLAKFEGDTGIDIDVESDFGFSMEKLMGESIIGELPQLMDRVETQVYHSLIEDRGGYLSFFSESNAALEQLPIVIRDAAQLVLADAFKSISLDKVIANNNLTREQLVGWLNHKLNKARPPLDQCGGGARVMVGLPQNAPSQILGELISTQFHVQTETLCGTVGSFVLCFEAEDIPIANVAFRLLELRPDAVDLVQRIHTRKDVQWTSLADLL